MAELTSNLFHGCGEGRYLLEVSGAWPDDIDGQILNVGPDRKAPDGHWFAGQGMVARTRCRPDESGRIQVDLVRIETPLSRLRSAHAHLFRRQGVLEVSPFGFSNFANTNVQVLRDRVFLGYDAGRPIELDPITLEYLTPVGANREWLQTLPASVEPLIAVAAHPAPDWDDESLWFANYEMIPLSERRELRLCAWDLEGEIRHWRLEDPPHFDSIHDVKATRNHVVISDLPFVTDTGLEDPDAPRRAVADHTTLWIVSKADVQATPPGEAVPHRRVEVPMMAGHLTVAYEEAGDVITVHLAHHPITDLGMSIDAGDRVQGTGELFPPDYHGLPPVTNQPCGFGSYRIDASSGKVLDVRIARPPAEFFGGLLFSQDLHREVARERPANVWVTSTGFDPGLVSERWWRTYAEVHGNVFVPPRDFPRQVIPGALARVDLAAGRFADLHAFAPGCLAHPATFVPRAGSTTPDDGYVVAMVHRDGDKVLEIFDANDLARGPLAQATAEGFNPPLLLHACWAPEPPPARASGYLVDPERDAWETLEAFGDSPGVSLSIGRAIFDNGRGST